MMTKFEFMTDLLGNINLLLEAGLNPCTVHATQELTNAAFDAYAELHDEPATHFINRGDLELINQTIANINEKVFELWQVENTDEPVKTEVDLIFNLHEITGVAFDEILCIEEFEKIAHHTVAEDLRALCL